jgi:predicted dehydrogenase
MNMKKRLRLGMIGGGHGAFIGAVHRLSARMDDKYEFVAGCLSSTPEKAELSAKELGLDLTRSYPDYKTMAEKESQRDDGIEVVSIVTPNHMHAGPAIEFLQKDIHVICDKPMTATMDDAHDLMSAIQLSKAHFFLTHNYSGYPVIREIRSLIKNGELGNLRIVKGAYLQGWLGSKEEDSGSNKQAEWRTDPKRSGAAGAVGDIGSHTMHLLEFVTGLKCESVAADLTTFVQGRQLDDDASIMIRMSENVKGNLSISQIATGQENNFTISIYGEKGALHWAQENPNYARFSRVGKADQIITRGGAIQNENSYAPIRIPPGHPEGYLEGFAQIYSDAADIILNHKNKNELLELLPGGDSGLQIMKFINASVNSSNNNSIWTDLSSI